MKEKILVKKNIPYLAAGLVLFIAVAFAFNAQADKNKYMNALHNTYRASLHNAAAHADALTDIHSVLPLAYTPENTAPLLAQLWRQGEAAHESLAALPYHDEMTAGALDYFERSADLGYELMVKSAKGTALTQADWAEINSLRQYSETLSSQLNMMLSQINLREDGVFWDQLQRETPYASDMENSLNRRVLLGSMAGVNQGLQGYYPQEETAYYGHALSTGSWLKGSRLLAAAREITSAEGSERVKDFLKGFDIDTIHYTGATDVTAENATPLYSYSVTLAGSSTPVIAIDITQEGGYPLWMLYYGEIEAGNNFISMEKAVKMGDKFLLDGGFENMDCIYQESIDGVALLHYVPVIDGVSFYTDLIKVKVSMVNGSILGYEASNYLKMHYDRGELTPKYTQEEAAESVSDQMLIKSAAMAVIPLRGDGEALCYEFKGDYDGQTYAIYINAVTGAQEGIIKNKA